MDHEAIGDVTVAAYREFLVGEDDGYLAQLRDSAARDDQAELWVATPDEAGREHEILGNVTICPPGSPWRELAAPGEGEFRMLAVAPTARRMGVGTALVGKCLDHFRKEGDNAVVLSSLGDMTTAHRIYARFGFVRTPDRDWQPVPGVQLSAFRLEL